MSINKTCPKCGSNKVELTHVKKRLGCLWAFLFGIWYFMLVLFKWIIGLMILVIWDWWFAIIMACVKKHYQWICKRFFVRRQIYYCHDCGYNFKA